MTTQTTLAMANDPAQRLHLAKNFQPDIDLLIKEGVAAFGIKGSGKSNLVGLLLEQLSRFFLPQVIFDTEGEFISLLETFPHGVLATAKHIPTGKDILTNGLQVVVDLRSFDCEDSAAIAMGNLVWQLLEFAGKQDPQDRVPCIVHMDESGFWLPQRAPEYLLKPNRDSLLDAFSILASRGRKYGLVPFLYTQQISQIHKSVIRQSGLLILMRQTFDTDLKRYGEYFPLTAERKEKIRSFPVGKAVIVMPDGSLPVVQFNERATTHTSHTPKAIRAVAKFAHMDFTYTIPTEPVPDGLISFEEQKEKRGAKIQSLNPLSTDVLNKIVLLCTKNQPPTIRDLTRYLKSLTKEQIQQVVKEMVESDVLVEKKSSHGVRYLLPAMQKQA